MKIKNLIKCALGLSLGLIILQTHANLKKPHTWHTVASRHGSWTATLQMINQKGGFVDQKGNNLNYFTISPGNSQDFGFYFEPGSDFDIAYMLTAVETKGVSTEKNTVKFVSKACVYIITAQGPGQPDIRISQYNGAFCEITKENGRTDFIIK